MHIDDMPLSERHKQHTQPDTPIGWRYYRCEGPSVCARKIRRTEHWKRPSRSSNGFGDKDEGMTGSRPEGKIFPQRIIKSGLPAALTKTLLRHFATEPNALFAAASFACGMSLASPFARQTTNRQTVTSLPLWRSALRSACSRSPRLPAAPY